MNFKEIRTTVEHLLKTSKCQGCKKNYTEENVHLIATTGSEGLFELRCNDCRQASIVTVVITPPELRVKSKDMNRKHGGISENDILDIKNFLTKFDGNFKKIFINEQS
jgi:hypothetical protein